LTRREFVEEALKKVNAEVLEWVADAEAKVRIYEVTVYTGGWGSVVAKCYNKDAAQQIANVLKDNVIERFEKSFRIKIDEDYIYFSTHTAMKVLGWSYKDYLREVEGKEV